MLYSMTGFGKATNLSPNGNKITVEIKSLNSKAMDLSARMSVALKEFEPMMRSYIAERLERGKVELNVGLESNVTGGAQTLNLPAIQNYMHQITQASSQLHIPMPEDAWAVILRLPEALQPETESSKDSQENQQTLETTLHEAVDALMAHRRAEGEKLEAFFQQRIDLIARYLSQVPQYETQRVEKIRERMEENIKKYTSHLELEPTRMEQEMFFYIEKLDINEEKQRLAQHLNYFTQTMHDQTGGQGKKLGFIAQEMGREINTLGSKSNNADMQQLVVKMKDVLEQIKEQVLNVM